MSTIREIRETMQMGADPFAGYSLQQDKWTAIGKTYTGDVQVCISSFSTGPEMPWGLPDPVNDWMSSHYFNEIQSAVEQNGGQLLRARLFEDKSPTLHTDWKAEITAAVPAGAIPEAGMGQAAMGIGWWGVVIGAALIGLVVYFLVRPTIDSVTKLVWGPGGGSTLLGMPWVFWLGAGLIVLSMSNSGKRGKQNEF